MDVIGGFTDEECLELFAKHQKCSKEKQERIALGMAQ